MPRNINFAAIVGRKKLINACKWASSSGLYNYLAIEDIFKNRQDELPLENNREEDTIMPSNANIRGKEYYQLLLSDKTLKFIKNHPNFL